MKVLVISYYWPPAGGPGVQRWLKFCSYLPEFGVEPVVYVPENPTYPITDPAINDEIPNGIQVLKQPIWEPYFLGNLLGKKTTKTLSKGIIDQNPSLLKKFLLFVRGNLFIPDARKAWVNPSVKYLSEHIDQNKYDAIITTGPPHSLHLIGHKLQQQTGIRWIADFRDPWTTIGYHKELRLLPWNAAKHKRLEKKVLHSADEIIVTSPGTKLEFQEITSKQIAVITNGFDESDKPNEAVALDSKFTIAHIGSLLAKRNPPALWKILKAICEKDENFKSDLKLVFAGVVAEEVKDWLKRYDLLDCAEFNGYVDHKEAIRLMHQSQLLLLLEIDSPETRSILPGKLYEYLMAERPILAIGPDGSDIEGILQESGSGTYFSHSNLITETLCPFFEDVYAAFKAGELKLGNNNTLAYSRRYLTEQLANLLKKRNPRPAEDA